MREYRLIDADSTPSSLPTSGRAGSRRSSTTGRRSSSRTRRVETPGSSSPARRRWRSASSPRRAAPRRDQVDRLHLRHDPQVAARPKARLEDMTFDGVDACFLYPSQRTMYFFMGNQDREFHLRGRAGLQRLLAQEFCSVDPERLFGLAQMPNLGVHRVIAEMQRCQELGLRGVIIFDLAPGGTILGPRGRPFFCGGARHGHAGLDPHPDPAQAQPAGRAHGRPRSATWRSPECWCFRRS